VNTFKNYVVAHDVALRKIPDLDLKNFVLELRKVLSNNGILWTAGNGGSASTASHAQCDLSKGLHRAHEFQSRVICLTDMTATYSAWANDFSFDTAIKNLCVNFVQTNDALLLISGSGNSQNILNAALYAKSKGIKVFALTGFDGGVLKGIADFCIHVPSTDMQVVEDIHLILVHWLFKKY
jgi:D-sedoheptulose 7-phosphate isomerase